MYIIPPPMYFVNPILFLYTIFLEKCISYTETLPKKEKEADTHPGIAPLDTCPPVYFFILY